MCSKRPEILVIDDDDQVLRAIEIMLSRKLDNVEVKTCHNAQEADQVRSDMENLAGALIDIHLSNGTSGEEYADQLRQRGADLGIALMSAMGMHEGRYRFLSKPFTQEEVLGIVEDMIANWSIREDVKAMRENVRMIRRTFEGAGYAPG